MSGAELESYCRRLRGVLKTDPPQSRSDALSWVLWPLLTGLGWSVDESRSDETGWAFECDLLLSIESNPATPALLVAVEPADVPLSKSRADTVGSAMDRSGIDRALYTNGRRFLFLAGSGPDGLAIDHSELPDHAEIVSMYTRDRLARHCNELDPRAAARRRLAVHRAELTESITADLESRLGPAGALEDEVMTTFLDVLESRLTATAESSTAQDGQSAFAEEPNSTGESTTESQVEWKPSTESNGLPSPAQSDDDSASSTESWPDTVLPETDPDGEYVVRVFDDRTSVGAVGHSTSAGALASATVYFYERGLTGVRLPFAQDDGTIVLNEEPVDEGGTEWEAYERLPKGVFVNTSGTVSDRADRVEALAERAGLRVLLTGDWGGRRGQ